MSLTNNNEPLVLYHGTNRKFTNHSLEKSRTELNDRFQGDWICYTPSKEVAWKYANAARNQCIDRDAFIEETTAYLNNNFNDKDFNDFLIQSFKILMDAPFDTAWDIIPEKYSERFSVDIDKASKHFFDRLNHYEELNPSFDFNDFYDVLEHVEYSKFGASDESNMVLNMFNNNIDEIPIHVIEFLESKNYIKSLPEPKVIESHITANKVLETNNREKAKQARENGYDLVIYSGPDCVDGVSEYLVADVSQVKMQTMTIAHKSIEYIDEGETEWYENISYESVDLKEKNQKKNKRRVRP